MTTALLVTAMVLLLAPYANAARPVQQRIGWLQGRASHWRYVCRHGRHETRRYACQARGWTVRELREARAEKHARDWDWQTWLPGKFARVGACETGYGRKPGNWRHDSGTYVSAFGILRVAYNQFARGLGLAEWNGRNVPRDQYRIAAAIERRYSWSAWGCGGR